MKILRAKRQKIQRLKIIADFADSFYYRREAEAIMKRQS